MSNGVDGEQAVQKLINIVGEIVQHANDTTFQTAEVTPSREWLAVTQECIILFGVSREAAARTQA